MEDEREGLARLSIFRRFKCSRVRLVWLVVVAVAVAAARAFQRDSVRRYWTALLRLWFWRGRSRLRGFGWVRLV